MSIGAESSPARQPTSIPRTGSGVPRLARQARVGGGDPVVVLVEATVVIRLFEQDPATTHLAVIGEIGGSDEERAAVALDAR